jgi:hypothetical protein
MELPPSQPTVSSTPVPPTAEPVTGPLPVQSVAREHTPVPLSVPLPAPDLKSDPSPSPVPEDDLDSDPSLLPLWQHLHFETPPKWDGYLATLHEFTENYREHFKVYQIPFCYAKTKLQTCMPRSEYESIRHMPSSINTIDGLFDHLLKDHGVDSELLITQYHRQFNELQCPSASPQHIVNFSTQHRLLASKLALPDLYLQESYSKALETFPSVKATIALLPTSYKYKDVVNEIIIAARRSMFVDDERLVQSGYLSTTNSFPTPRPHGRHLTADEKRRRRDNGLCAYCGGKHTLLECTQRSNRNASKVSPTDSTPRFSPSGPNNGSHPRNGSSINTIDGLFDHLLKDQGVDSEFLITQYHRQFNELQCRSASPQHIVDFSSQHRRLARKLALPDLFLEESYRKALKKFPTVKAKLFSLPTSYKYEDVVKEIITAANRSMFVDDE